MTPCAICKGAPEDHGVGKSQHVYTETPGHILTHEQAAKQQKSDDSGFKVATMPQPANTTMMDRLVETLLIRGLIDAEDAVYIMLGHPKQRPTGDKT